MTYHGIKLFVFHYTWILIRFYQLSPRTGLRYLLGDLSGGYTNRSKSAQLSYPTATAVIKGHGALDRYIAWLGFVSLP